MKNVRGLDRPVVLGPQAAMVLVDVNAKPLSFRRDGVRVPYWACKLSVPGGFVELFIFGEGVTPGNEYPAVTEVKTKPGKNGAIYYIRAETFECRKHLSHRLYVGEIGGGKINPQIPSIAIQENGRSFEIGFVPA